MVVFFQGWRRKVGCVTLLMACLFMTGWVRGLFFVDFLWFPGEKGAYLHQVMFTRNMAIFQKSVSLSSDFLLPWDEETFYVNSYPRWQWRPSDDMGFLLANYPKVTWRCRVSGFDIVEASADDDIYRGTFVAIPYFSIITPLTLLSAWLLLSKPRVVNPT